MYFIIIRYLIMLENETVNGQNVSSHRNVLNVLSESPGLLVKFL